MTDTHGEPESFAWIGVDLDGTLAHYDGWKGPDHIGKPIPKMVDRVNRWIKEGKNVRIVTARVAPGKGNVDICHYHINVWQLEHLDAVLPVTHEKDHLMIELWDDRCVQVIPNTGLRADGKED